MSSFKSPLRTTRKIVFAMGYDRVELAKRLAFLQNPPQSLNGFLRGIINRGLDIELKRMSILRLQTEVDKHDNYEGQYNEFTN